MATKAPLSLPADFLAWRDGLSDDRRRGYSTRALQAHFAAGTLPPSQGPRAGSVPGYRGKYPTRIAEVSTLTGRPGVVYVRTNDGRALEATACALSGQLPKVGQDVADWAGFRPFRRALSRTFAALARIDAGSDQTVPAEGIDARELAAACIVAARRALGPGAARSVVYGYAAGCALQLALDHSGGQDWSEVASPANAMLRARVVPAHRRAAVRALRAKHAGTALLAAYRARRAARMARVLAIGRDMTAGHHDGYNSAVLDLNGAREDAARLVGGKQWRARLSGRPARDILGHGDALRTRTRDGRRVTFAIAHIPDDDMGAPWTEHDGHGVIRELTRLEVKAPGDVLFSGEDRHSRKYAYDIPATMAKARAEGWGLAPDDLAEFAAKLGRTPTARQVTAEAVRRDLERCRGWVRDEWNWLGVALIEMPRRADAWDSTNAREVADSWLSGGGRQLGRMAASLWGIEGDSDPEYFDETARELLSDAVTSR